MRNAQEPFYFAPQRKLDGGWICWKDSPSPPPAPDYTGAATATASGNIAAAQQAQQANMVNQYTPYGSLTYSQSGQFPSGNPQYTSNINLSPTGEALLSASDRTRLGLSGLTQGAEQNVANTMSKPFDLSGVQQTADASYKAQTARLDPQWAQNTEMNDAKLANQGITQGSQAYNDAQRTFGQQQNDAYSQARLNAIATEPQTYQLASAAYNQPLNELNALTTGSQVENPTFSSSPQQQTAAGPNYLGAAQASGQYGQGLYNAQVGANNATTAGIGQLGSAALMAFMLSDERLKKDIHKIADDPRGFGIHTFRYKWDKPYESPRIGVMAQELEEVMPEAVFSLGGPDGVKAVDYGRL